VAKLQFAPAAFGSARVVISDELVVGFVLTVAKKLLDPGS
jgi:hypothetical protein